MVNIPDEYKTEYVDETWRVQAIESGFTAIVDKINRGRVKPLNELELVNLRTFVEDEFQEWEQKHFNHEDVYLTEFNHPILYALATSTMQISTDIKMLVSDLSHKCTQEKIAYSRDSWEETGRFTKPKSKEREAFNEEKSQNLEAITDECISKITTLLLHEEGVTHEQIILNGNIQVLRKERKELAEGFARSMHVAAGKILSEGLPKQGDDQVFEGGREGTSRLRKFVDGGGILKSINSDARNQTFVVREGEKYVKYDQRIWIVPEE